MSADLNSIPHQNYFNQMNFQHNNRMPSKNISASVFNLNRDNGRSINNPPMWNPNQSQLQAVSL